ncbi:13306_t:CDS:2, partial [Dentiscutata erythropus]
LHRQGYRIIEYSEWTYMLKWLSNSEYYRINESDNERIVRRLEYTRYMCKMHGKSYPCDSLKINYFETKYLYTLEKEINIDFSDLNNNCEPPKLTEEWCRIIKSVSISDQISENNQESLQLVSAEHDSSPANIQKDKVIHIEHPRDGANSHIKLNTVTSKRKDK